MRSHAVIPQGKSTSAAHPARGATRPARLSLGGSNQLLQAKPRIGRADDPLEREADRVAERVLAGRDIGSIGSAVAVPQRESADCPEEDETLQRQTEGEEEEEELLQPKAEVGSPSTTGAAAAASALGQGGRPLSAGQRAYFEPRFGHDFSAVRIHDDPRAHAAARSIDARAYTLGNHIAFAPEAYDPGSAEGTRLIAHELTHTLQQQGPGVIRRDGNHAGLTDVQRYEHTLQHAGTTRAAWDRGYRNARFLGVRIRSGIHQELDDRLTLAEDHLRTRFPDLDDSEIAQEIGLDTISGRRTPGNAVGGSTISNHGYGLAIDVNYRANPFVGRSQTVDEIMNRATLFVLGREFHIRQQQEGTSEEVRARYAEASAALSTYFRYFVDQDFAGLARAMSRELPEAARGSLTGGSPYTTETMAMMEQIGADYNNPELRADFAASSGPDRDPVNGFIDFTPALVEAFVDQAGLTWGGQYRTGKDIMHFDWRGGTVRTGHRI